MGIVEVVVRVESQSRKRRIGVGIVWELVPMRHRICRNCRDVCSSRTLAGCKYPSNLERDDIHQPVVHETVVSIKRQFHAFQINMYNIGMPNRNGILRHLKEWASEGFEPKI